MLLYRHLVSATVPILLLLSCFALHFCQHPFVALAFSLTLTPLPGSPTTPSTGVFGSVQCTKNSDEAYAVCGSRSNTAIKYNLHPFAFGVKGPDQGLYMQSCDLFETSSQSASRAVCVKGNEGTNGIVYFHRVSDLTVTSNVSIGTTGYYPYVTVDTPNQIAYISNYYSPAAIYKITDIGSVSPSLASILSALGSGDIVPAAMLIIDGFLYAHCYMSTGIPARVARVNIAAFTWNQTVSFESGELYGSYDNLANDDNFIYDLVLQGIIIRCTYKNNNFCRFDSLNTGHTTTYSLVVSVVQRVLFFSSYGSNLLLMIDIASFSVVGNSVSVVNVLGRPIVTRSCNVYAFCAGSNSIYAFNMSTCRKIPTATNSRSITTQSPSSAISHTIQTITNTNTISPSENSASVSVSIRYSKTQRSSSRSVSRTSSSTSESPSIKKNNNSHSETHSREITSETTRSSISVMMSSISKTAESKVSKSKLSTPTFANPQITNTTSTSPSSIPTQSPSKLTTQSSSSKTPTLLQVANNSRRTISPPTHTLTKKIVSSNRVDPVRALPGVKDVAASVGAIAAFTGIGAVAVQENRLSAITSLIHCGEGSGISDDEPDFLASPLMLRIGDDLFGWHRGLLVGNILVLVIFSAVVAAISFVYSKIIGKCDFQTALLHLRFPGIVMLPTVILLPPSAEKAVALFWFSEGNGGKDFFLAIFCGSILVFAPCVVTLMVCHVSARGRLVMHKEHIEQGRFTEKKCPKLTETSIYKMFQYLTEIQFEFTDGKSKTGHEESNNNTQQQQQQNILDQIILFDDDNNDANENQHHHMSKRGTEGAMEFLSQNPWVARVGPIVEDFSLLYFAFVDISVSAVLGFMAGTAAGPVKFPHCLAIFSINIICCSIHLLLLLRYRGVTPRFLLIYVTAASAITLFAVVLALTQYLGRLLDPTSTWDYLELVQAILGLFVAILGMIGLLNSFYQFVEVYVVGIDRFRKRKRSKSRNDEQNDGAIINIQEVMNVLDDFLSQDELKKLAETQSHVEVEQQHLTPFLDDLDEPSAEERVVDDEIKLDDALGSAQTTAEATTNVRQQIEAQPNLILLLDDVADDDDDDDLGEKQVDSILLDEEDDDEARRKESETINRKIGEASRGNEAMLRNQDELTRMLGSL